MCVRLWQRPRSGQKSLAFPDRRKPVRKKSWDGRLSDWIAYVLVIEKELLVELLGQKLPTRKIAAKIGLSEKTVLYWERKYGLSPAFASCGNGRRRRSPREMAEAMAQAPINYRRRIKARAIAYKGGSCVICSYNKCNAALEFHHVDKARKTFGLSRKGIIRSWDSIRRELDKCILVCANCHREVEAGLRKIPSQNPPVVSGGST